MMSGSRPAKRVKIDGGYVPIWWLHQQAMVIFLYKCWLAAQGAPHRR